MKRIKYIAFVLVLVAQMVLMVHNAIPHHHHHHTGSKCHTEYTYVSHTHDHHVCSYDKEPHLCDSCNCETCTLLSDPFECHSQSFGLTIIGQYTKIHYYLAEDGNLVFESLFCIGSVLQKISVVSGLRAPPYYM